MSKREYVAFYEPKLGRGYAYHFPTGGIFELSEEEYRRLPAEDLLEEMRSYDGPSFSVEDFVSHLSSVGAEIGGLSTPAYVEIEVTQRCNLRCAHCYVPSSPTSPDGLPAAEWAGIVRGLRRTVMLGITGGEPLLKDSLVEILKAAKEAGHVIKLLTNGTLLPQRLPELLTVMEPGVDIVQVSIDGGREAHEAIRGPGTFDRAVEAVRLASKHFRVEVAFTLLPTNKDSAEEAYVAAAEAGASVFRVGPVAPIGRGAAWSVRYSDLIEVTKRLKELEQEYGVPVSSEFSEPADEDAEAPLSGFFTCSAGISFAFIGHDGTMYPCQMYRPILPMGNALREHPYKIWERFDRRVLMRDLRGTKCASCPLFPQCRGGCPALALRLKGTINAPSPHCDIM